MANVAKQAAYLSHRTKDVEEVSARVARGLGDLRGRIEMARHAADSVKISLTNDWEEPVGFATSVRHSGPGLAHWLPLGVDKFPAAAILRLTPKG